MNNEPIIKSVNGLQFSIMSPGEIREYSVVEITIYPLLKVYLI